MCLSHHILINFYQFHYLLFAQVIYLSSRLQVLLIWVTWAVIHHFLAFKTSFPRVTLLKEIRTLLPNYDTCNRFQNYQIPSSEVSQQNLDVRSFPETAQLIKSEVEKIIKKLSTEYQQSKSADSQFQLQYKSVSEPYSTESTDDEISAIVHKTQSRVKLEVM